VNTSVNIRKCHLKFEFFVFRASPGSFGKTDFEKLRDSYDSFSVMTYDYSSNSNPGANSPITWARTCMENLCPSNTNDHTCKSKLLMGLNFYGYDYTPMGGGPILGSQFALALSSVKAKVSYDDRSMEHFFEYK
jgi:chitinase domain-containing protein 1